MMQKRISLIFVVAVIALIAAAAAVAGPGVAREDLSGIMPLSQVRAGMKGYGLTVFRGTKIEKFDVQVVGILRKVNAGKDWILVKLAGGPITGRGANIIQGMSGSPVYVNGKIIGAVAYSAGLFSREPIGMLTPIEDMLEALDPKLPARPSGLSSAASTLSSPIKVGDETIRRVEIRYPSSGTRPADGTLVLTPLMTPLMVSGMSNRGIARLAELLEPYGIAPMAGPGAKADPVPAELKPGAAVGVSLATGDIDLTAVGTLTYRRGSKVIAFGHPMLGIGPIDAPMTTAYVHDVFPSLLVSSKIASPMKVVGRIFQDRPWSVGGEVGKLPSMIPVTIVVDDAAIGRKRTMRINSLSHPLLAARLLLILGAEALMETHGLPDDAMARVRLEIDADQVGKIVRENTFFDPASIEIAALEDLQALLNILTNNRFHPVDVKSLHMSVRIESGRRTATVERIWVDKNKYEPGETVNVGVELRPYKAETITKDLSVTIPEWAADGRMMLQVGRGMMALAEGGPPMAGIAEEARAGRSPMVPSGTAENIRQVIDKYLEREKNNELVAKLVFPSPVLSVAGEKLENLPEAVASVMKSPKSTATKFDRQEVKSAEPTDYIIIGGHALPIRVERRRLAEKKQPARPGPQPSPPEAAPSAPPPPAVEVEEEQAEEITDYSIDARVELAPPAASPPDETHTVEQAAPPPPSAAKAAPTAKPDATPAAKADQKSPEKPVGRQPGIWRQQSARDFSLGVVKGAAATSADDVRPAPAMDKLADLSARFVWRVVPDGQGGVYAGTGNDGIVYRIDRDGSSTAFLKTGELEVHSLAVDSRGTLYAGTSPNGKVFRIGGDGKGEVVFDAPGRYVLALAADSKDNVYAGLGDAGTIYRVAPGGSGEEFARLPVASVLALAVDKSDNLYAGTGPEGVIYRVAPDGTASAVYNAAEDSVTSIVVDADGAVYAGTGSGKGNIYKIPPTGAPKAVFDKAPRALSLAIDAANNVYAVSDEQIVRIAPDETVLALDLRRSGAQFISVAVDSAGTIFAGTANGGSVYRSSSENPGVYESPVHDTGLPSRWGKISWIADLPEGTSASLQTRTGNVAEPDGTWSDWSAAYSVAAGQQITSPPARYIQYRSALTGSGGASPVLKQVSVAYLTENRPPKVTVNDPQPGSVIARSYSIKWTGADPDKDALTYDLYYSADAGKTWQPLGSGVKQSKNGAETEPKKEPAEEPKQETPNKEEEAAGMPDADDLVAQLKAELDRHPEIPQDVKDRMLAEAPAAVEKSVAAVSSPPDDPSEDADAAPSGQTNSTKQTSYKWDTTKVPDGTYVIKIVGSDRISNAIGFLTDEKVVGPVVVANKPPRVAAFQKEIKVNSDRTVRLDGYAYHDLAPLAGVQFKVGSGDWMAAAAVDGIFDSTSEPFTITTQPLAKGKHSIEVKAIDAAGNSATAKATANVE